MLLLPPMTDWTSLRKNYISAIPHTYLNSAANGLISIDTISHVQNEILKFRKDPGTYRLEFIGQTIPDIKKVVSQFLQASPTEIALIQNFSIGLNLYVQSLPKETKIALVKNDYPSLTMPFEVNEFPIFWTSFESNKTLDLSKLEIFFQDHKPDLFALSHCQWLSGYLADLESIGKLCKQYDCLLLVDATQSFGAVSIDVKKYNRPLS